MAGMVILITKSSGTRLLMTLSAALIESAFTALNVTRTTVLFITLASSLVTCQLTKDELIKKGDELSTKLNTIIAILKRNDPAKNKQAIDRWGVHLSNLDQALYLYKQPGLPPKTEQQFMDQVKSVIGQIEYELSMYPMPTDKPTVAPTDQPGPHTDPPTDPPTDKPTDPPTDAPTGHPTDQPTVAPIPTIKPPETCVDIKAKLQLVQVFLAIGIRQAYLVIARNAPLVIALEIYTVGVTVDILVTLGHGTRHVQFTLAIYALMYHTLYGTLLVKCTPISWVSNYWL
ncbi:unnamed protein product [Medioppia subpectinata]|uniref:Uncharacterized protein n=1 Tax=Medioppia subpectinata TaxID=1979941 RepID=A0A7R9KMF0_9ACAR|nr:unnamed protein product [Medioppia subpectinata]CAG2105952.1 unnamed protein product [Medioppia subpectinata]